MNRGIWLASLLLASVAARAAPSYRLEGTIPLGAPDKWDYVTFDGAGQRVLVAHATATDVIDAKARRVIGKLAPLQGAHGNAVLPDGRIAADSGRSGTLSIFDGTDWHAIRTVPAGEDADAVAYEPVSHRVAVMNGDPGTATLVDAVGGTPSITVPLGGSPEYAVVDGKGALFVNIADKSELVKMEGGRVTARWSLKGCESPHGLAIDAKQELLFSSCINQRLFVVNGKSGAVLQTLPIGRGTDSAAFDPKTGRVFSSNGDGTLSVFQESGAKLQKLDDVMTAPGARTMAADPASGRLYLVTADAAGALPPGHGGKVPHFAFKPGTVKLLIFAPAGG